MGRFPRNRSAPARLGGSPKDCLLCESQRQESNLRHPLYESDALPTELRWQLCGPMPALRSGFMRNRTSPLRITAIQASRPQVLPEGLEPSTNGLEGHCSFLLSYESKTGWARNPSHNDSYPHYSGFARATTGLTPSVHGRTRTCDFLLRKQALCPTELREQDRGAAVTWDSHLTHNLALLRALHPWPTILECTPQA